MHMLSTYLLWWTTSINSHLLLLLLNFPSYSFIHSLVLSRSPSAAIGHLVSMVELAKFILIHHHHHPLSIHILTTTPPYDVVSTSTYIASVSTTIDPSIIFHNLPPISLPPSLLSSTPNHESLMFELLRLNNPNVLHSLISVSQNYVLRAFVADLFCFQALSLVSSSSTLNNIPSYCFFPSAAASLASFLYLPTLHHTINKSLKEVNTHLHIPGNPPMATSDMPKPLLERNDLAYQGLVDSSIAASKTNGIIVNTFEALESRSLKAISDGLCIPNAKTPPIYPIGPLIVYDESKSSHQCLKWLDSQPNRSVVFLCFGSLGVFSKQQLHQIACGLEKSKQRFLWVIRNPPLENLQNLAATSQDDPDLETLLPEGFLKRTEERGMVVKKWAPQVSVLNHGSVGGFVTHCGWNSVLEAVSAGVPMVAWPLYAEQRFNRVVMVEEMKIALWMKEEEESGMVKAEEVEERVKELMESEKGELVRERVRLLKNQAEAALKEKGSSMAALDNLTQSWKEGKGR